MPKWLFIAASAGLMYTVAQAAGPEFEVASIKAAAQQTPELFRTGKIHLGMTVDGGRVDIGGMPLAALLQQAFRVKLFQVVAPDWVRESRWDILAKLPDGASQDQIPEMLQALLADRFKLVVHRETRELPVYELTVAKGGPKMKISEPDPDSANDANAAQANGAFGFSFGPPSPPPPGRGPGRGSGDGPGRGNGVIATPQFGPLKISGSPQDGRIHLEASKVGMAGLADLLTPMTDRPVFDKTGLSENYQVALDLSPEEMFGGMARTQAFGFGPGGPGGPGVTQTDGASDPSGGAVLASLAKLGLKLDARKAPVETIVVDHLEKTPTEN